jgi:integrase
MKGSIRKRGKNSWQIQIYTGLKPDGKPKRHFETVKGNKGDAQRRLHELLSSLDKGVYTPPGRLTFAEHLNNWLDGYVKVNCLERTLDNYRSIVNYHFIPELGHILLRQLTPQAIQSYYGRACERISARTVLYHHRILKESLKYAVRQGYLGRNPADLVDPPKPRKKTMRTLTPEEIKTLLEVALDNQFYPVIYTAISTGLRETELLGLRWRDIDLNLQSISVCQILYYKKHDVFEFKEPKTSHSKRRVKMTAKLVDYLGEYKGTRESLSLHLGRLLKPDDLIFAKVEGSPFNPSVLRHNFTRMVNRAGLKGLRFHDLRHTFATLMLKQGAKPKVISEALGHASVAFTLDTYGHVIEGMQSEAMALLDEILPPGKSEAGKQGWN